jgi:hypothetical protein
MEISLPVLSQGLLIAGLICFLFNVLAFMYIKKPIKLDFFAIRISITLSFLAFLIGCFLYLKI